MEHQQPKDQQKDRLRDQLKDHPQVSLVFLYCRDTRIRYQCKCVDVDNYALANNFCMIQEELALIQLMARRIIGETVATNMHKTYIGAATITTLSFNPRRCAVFVEVAAINQVCSM